jgi:hypothetical protein
MKIYENAERSVAFGELVKFRFLFVLKIVAHVCETSKLTKKGRQLAINDIRIVVYKDIFGCIEKQGHIRTKLYYI